MEPIFEAVLAGTQAVAGLLRENPSTARLRASRDHLVPLPVEALAGTYTFLLSDDTDQGTVDSMLAGTNCVFR